VLWKVIKAKGTFKTNVWVEIKRRGKYLQSVEDIFKEKKENNGSSNKD